MKSKYSKRFIFRSVSSFFLLFLAPVLYAQTPEPQYVGQYAFIGPTGQLEPLEATQAHMETKTKNHFISNSVTSVFTVPGSKSTFRVGPAAHFVVRVPGGMDSTDPNTLISLRAFTVSGSSRTLAIASASGGIFQSTKGGTAPVATIPISFKRYGQNSLEIIPQQPLPAGEYTIGMANISQALSCFGVDPNGPTSAIAPAPAPKPVATPQLSFIQWSAPLASPLTKNVKAACESKDSAGQAYCYAILSTLYDDLMSAMDGENFKPAYCFPPNETAAQLRDAFLVETVRRDDQLDSPIGLFYGGAMEHAFPCPKVDPPKKPISHKKK